MGDLTLVRIGTEVDGDPARVCPHMATTDAAPLLVPPLVAHNLPRSAMPTRQPPNPET